MSDHQRLSTERDARNSAASGLSALNESQTATADRTRLSGMTGVSGDLTMSRISGASTMSRMSGDLTSSLNPPDETDFEAADNFSTMVLVTSDVKIFPHRKADNMVFRKDKVKRPLTSTKVPIYTEYSIDGFSFHMTKELISHGSIGVVMKATNDTDGNQDKIVVKFTDDWTKNAALSKEIKILQKLGQDESAKEYFPKIYCYVYLPEDNFMCSVMGRQSKTLHEHIQDQEDLGGMPISLHLIRCWLKQMCDAAVVLRSYRIRNPSLSTRNFMLAGDYHETSRIVMIHLHDSIVTRTSTRTPDFKNLKKAEFTPIEVLLKAKNVDTDKMEEYSIAMIAMRLLTNKSFLMIRREEDFRMHILFKLLGDAPIEYKKVTTKWYEKTANGEWERNMKYRTKYDDLEKGRKQMGIPSSFEEMVNFYPRFYSTSDEKKDLEALVHVIMVLLKYLPADRESIANVLQEPFFTLHGYTNEGYNTTARNALNKELETIRSVYAAQRAKNELIREAR